MSTILVVDDMAVFRERRSRDPQRSRDSNDRLWLRDRAKWAVRGQAKNGRSRCMDRDGVDSSSEPRCRLGRVVPIEPTLRRRTGP